MRLGSSCLFETLKLIYYLDVMNFFVICHLDVNVMINELMVAITFNNQTIEATK